MEYKFKVICQSCGKTEVENPFVTPSSGWGFFKINEVIEGLDQHQDWDIWLCDKCLINMTNLEESNQLPEDWWETILEVKRED